MEIVHSPVDSGKKEARSFKAYQETFSKNSADDRILGITLAPPGWRVTVAEYHSQPNAEEW